MLSTLMRFILSSFFFAYFWRVSVENLAGTIVVDGVCYTSSVRIFLRVQLYLFLLRLPPGMFERCCSVYLLYRVCKFVAVVWPVLLMDSAASLLRVIKVGVWTDRRRKCGRKVRILDSWVKVVFWWLAMLTVPLMLICAEWRPPNKTLAFIIA